MRPHATKFLAFILLLGFSGGMVLSRASAAPGARGLQKGRVRASKRCAAATPTKEQCLEVGYLDACLKHKKACEPHLEAGFKQFATDPKYGYAAAPEQKMLRPNRDAIPKDLRDGKFFAYVPSGNTAKRGGSKSLIDRTNLTGPATSASVAQAMKAHRNPKWENNGAKAKDCHELAYEETYDWARFTDATAACRGDWRCQMDIALLPTTPGIADRTLMRKDRRPTKTQLQVGAKGPVPKNDLFVVGKLAKLFVLAGPPMKTKKGSFQVSETPELSTLIDTLEDGKDHYRVGCKRGSCKGSNAFENTWDMHRKLYDRNKGLSMAEFEEYDRRKREFNRLLDEWAAEVDRELDAIKALGRTPVIDRVQMPFEWVIDPHERLGIFEAQHKVVKKNLSKLATPLLIVPNQKAPSKQGALPMPVTTVFAAPTGRTRGWAKPTKTPSSASKGATYTDSIDFCEAWGNKTSKTEHLGYGPYTCRVGRFLRNEYARLTAGEKSCLDLSDDDCDWSPAGFRERFVEGVPYLEEQKAYLDECEGWMPSKFDKTLAGVEKEIVAIKVASKKAWGELQPYAKKKGGKVESLGKIYNESNAWGDKDFLAVDYNASVGWKITPEKHAGEDVCQLGGRADASFGTSAWMLGGKVPMVSSDVAAALNEGGSAKLAIGGELRVLGQSVFTKKHNTGALVYSVDAGDTISFPKPKPTWSVMAGPVPVTGSVWGEIFYGATFDAKGKLGNHCTKEEITFGMDTTTTPMFMISALGQVGVGIGGVASAGVRGMVNLITFGFPVSADVGAKLMNTTDELRPHLTFDVGMDLLLSTLSGKLMLYIEVLFVESTFELFRWHGLKTQIPMMQPLGAELPLISWKK